MATGKNTANRTKPFSARLLLILLGCLSAAAVYFSATDPLVADRHTPVFATAASDGKVYLSRRRQNENKGEVLVLKDGKAIPFATPALDPRGLAAGIGCLFVVDRQRVWAIDCPSGKAEQRAGPGDFPTPPQSLQDIAVDGDNNLYVTDAGSGGQGAAVYRIARSGRVSVVVSAAGWPGLKRPAGLVLDGAAFLLLADAASGTLHRINIFDGRHEQVAAGLGQPTGLAWDRFGQLFISDAQGGRLLGIPRPGMPAIPLRKTLPAVGGPCLDPAGKGLLVVNPQDGTVNVVPAQIPGFEVDDAPLPLEPAAAFAGLEWTGWQFETPQGMVRPLRPIVLTHAGDGSNRVFVATQHGAIHVFANDPQAAQTKVFLDLQDRVVYADSAPEEGFLGLAFHPRYRKNGEFFVFYTTNRTKEKHTNVLCRYRVSKDDPDRADAASEEELLRIDRPFWEHNGGTICFGPDGYLYLALGDGGGAFAGDPWNHAQNLETLLGSILRIDVDRQDPGKSYSVPKDNPFVHWRAEGRKPPEARPEIWAYGLRNVWRMAFDRKTGRLWAADVGQKLYEEINRIDRGGNYGWKLREAMHPFQGAGPRQDLIEPIWEYHHDLGSCCIGGQVYRGKRLPELEGHYLYGDHVTGKLWALRYDEAKSRVVANRPFAGKTYPLMSFGEDEAGEVYFLVATLGGPCIYRFAWTEAGR